MALNESPTIIEPSKSSEIQLPNIPSLSPNPSSSSDSFDSSRPNSNGSSATSRSVSPSPVPKRAPTIDSHESVEACTLPSNPPLPEGASVGQSPRQNTPPRSVQPTLAVNPVANHEPRRNWFPNTLGSLNLGLALIGLLIFGKLAIWTAWNDTLNTCFQQVSAQKELGPNCQRLLSAKTVDVTLPPWKRGWNATFEAVSRLKIDGITKRYHFPNDELGSAPETTSISTFSSVAIVLASTVIIGGLSLIIFRRYWRTEEVFTSPVRSDWQFTRHHQEGPETVSGDGYRMIRRNPEDGHPLGQLRQHIRSSQPNAVENPTGEPRWQSHNTSDETLVGPWKDTKLASSKVSLTNEESDEKHENLIELETEGPNKTFFDPETGEFIHLTPWKSTGDEEVHGLKPDGKGSIKRAFAQMTLGATGWAGGKNIDDQLAEELQANSKGLEKNELEELKAGDCITGTTSRSAADGGLEDPIAAVNEEDKSVVDPKVTAFLLRRPWYAGTQDVTPKNAEADTTGGGAGVAEDLDPAPMSDSGQDEAAPGIPQSARVGNPENGSSEEDSGFQAGRWQAILAQSEAYTRAERYQSRVSSDYDGDSIISSDVSIATQAGFEATEHALILARQQKASKRDRWQRFRSIKAQNPYTSRGKKNRRVNDDYKQVPWESGWV